MNYRKRSTKESKSKEQNMKVDPQFEHLVVVDSRDYLSGDEVAKLFDSDTADPVHEFFKKTKVDRFNTSAGVSDFSWDSPLTATAPPETRSVDLSKASSGRNRIRLEKSVDSETGEIWVHGFDHNGEIVYSRVEFSRT
jgi:hypothetical protein